MLSNENYGGVQTLDRFREYVRGGVPALTVVLGCGPACAQTVENLVARYGVPTIMVGADAPEILSPQVQRVRTISACVEEGPPPSSRPRPTWSSLAAPDALDRSRATVPSTARKRPPPSPAAPGQVIP